jgi:hypothetical protein
VKLEALIERLVPRKVKNRMRAEGLKLGSYLLKAMGESMDPEEGLRHGMLLAAGVCSVLEVSIRTGVSEAGFVDVDGTAIPVDLTVVTEN